MEKKSEKNNRKNMKLVYATSLTFPSGLANRLQTLAMAKELAKKLAEDFYLGVGGIGESDVREKNKSINIINFGITKSYILAFRYLKFIKKNNISHVYCREPRLMLFILLYSNLFFKKCKLSYEMHELAERNLFEKFINWIFSKKIDNIIFVTRNLRNLYIKKYSFKKEKTLVAPDGVDLKIFDLNLTKGEARGKASLPADKKIIGFFGRFKTMGMDKGLNDILKSLSLLDQDILLLAMGGKLKDIEYYKKMAKDLGVLKKVIFVEHLNQNEVAVRQKACDALLMPFPYNQHYAFYMSPLKMFEYMASKRPIIATDLPSVREILSDNNSILIKPGSRGDLVSGIKKVLQNNDLASRIVHRSFFDIKKYTWEMRVEKILTFL